MRRIVLKKWMLDHRISQADICRITGISAPAVCLFIKGERISGEKAKAIGHYLRHHGCPHEFLEIKR